MSTLPDRLVGRHLAVLAGAVALFAAACALDHPLVSLLTVFLPAASLVVARALSVPFGEPLYVRGFRWAAFIALVLGVLSVQAPIPGVATLTALSFLWIGASRGSGYLAGVSFAAACALMPLDITGVVRMSAPLTGSVAHVSALGVVAFVVGALAYRALRRDAAHASPDAHLVGGLVPRPEGR